MRFLFVLLCCCIVTYASAQLPQITKSKPLIETLEDEVREIKRNDPQPFAKTITREELEKHLSIIASDDFEGRETGTEGQRKAAKYIADQFKEFGIPPSKNGSYFQEYPLQKEEWGTVEIKVNGKDFKYMRDYYAFRGSNQHMPQFNTKEVIFLGYGIDDEKYSDYEGVDVKGKVVLIWDREPKDADGKSYITGTKALSKWSKDWQQKIFAAKKHGVKTLMMIDPSIQSNIAMYRSWLIEPSMTLVPEKKEGDSKFTNNFYISSTLAEAIMGRKRYKKVVKLRKKIKETGASAPIKLKAKMSITQEMKIEKVMSTNVMGFIEGSDPILKDEIVVITGHYDHLGKRVDDIFNGADDNGSGTSALLELAQAFALAKKEGKGTPRSVLIMLLSGEEKGLLGSEYYVNNPVYPLKQTIVDINVDMIGRVDKEHTDKPDYIYVIGSNRLSTELHSINEKANETYTKLDLDYQYNRKDDPNQYYYRSDHYNFAEKGIPAVFFFSGVHKDYHKPTDTHDKIQFEKMTTITQLVFYTAWELASRDKRIRVDVKNWDGK